MVGPITRAALSAALIMSSAAASGAALAQDGAQSGAEAGARPGDALAVMEGAWAGEGWIVAEDRQRYTFDVFERAEIGSAGHAVIFRGEGFTPAGAGREGEPVHDATGVITRAGAGYEMRAVTGHGQMQDVPFEILQTETSVGYRWTLDIGPQGEVVYEAVIQDGVWTETGAYCPTGAGECFQTFYMRLERVG